MIFSLHELEGLEPALYVLQKLAGWASWLTGLGGWDGLAWLGLVWLG